MVSLASPHVGFQLAHQNMDTPTTTNALRAHLDEFQTYISNHLFQGYSCDGKPRQYVQHSALANYWTHDRFTDIVQILLLDKADQVSRKRILEKFLRVFSVLVYVSDQDHSILYEVLTLVRNKVTDDRLPSAEPQSYLSESAWKLFEKHQWTFFPLELGSDDTQWGHLDSRCIFPGVATTPESLGRLEKRVNGLRDAKFTFLQLENEVSRKRKSTQLPEVVVVKSYPSSSQGAYNNEVSFFSRSEQSRRRSENILRCLGCYSCNSRELGETYNIVLEYGSKGSLLEYFESESKPSTYADKKAFWSSIIPFLVGLEYMHHKDDGMGGSISVHHDIKPANIIVFPGVGGRFDFTAKICDFGLTNTKGQPAPLGPHREGSSTYGAPERCLADQVPYAADPAVDLFSAGCVLLEAAAWVTGGTECLQMFRQRRQAEIKAGAAKLYYRGHKDCFHNGFAPLQCVLEAASTFNSNDPLTSAIIDVVIGTILGKDGEERLAAGRLFKQLERVIINGGMPDSPLAPDQTTHRLRTDSSSCHTPPSRSSQVSEQGRNGILRPSLDSNDREPRGSVDRRDGSPSQSSQPRRVVWPPPPHLSDPSPAEILPYLSFEQVREWRRKGKESPLKGRDVALKELKHRDHILVIDNSVTMQNFKTDLLDKVPLLAYILKQVDPDGVEVMLTNDCEFQKYTTASEIQNYASRNFSRGKEAGCHMERCLEAVFDKIDRRLPSTGSGGGTRKKLTKKLLGQPSGRVCVYFLTDGAWAENYTNPDDDPLERTFKRRADNLQERALDRYVSFQFIRFGQDPAGIRKLSHLDNFLPPDRDFIDHKPINSGVWHLLVGALMRRIDND